MRLGARLSPGTVVPAHATISLMHGASTAMGGSPSQKEVLETDEPFEVPETGNGYWYRLDALPAA
jgi:hypothetical protein